MTENTNQTLGATAGYGPEGRELERESLAYGEPARTPGDVETAAVAMRARCSARCCNPRN